MFRSFVSQTFRSRRRFTPQIFLPVLSFDDTSDQSRCGWVSLFLQRQFGQKGPGKRSKYALRKKEEIEGYKKSPFGVTGRPVKHFDELKFYHARNKYGQKQTLVDSRRRDIDFFDPVAGGYDKWTEQACVVDSLTLNRGCRDPRNRYKGVDSDGDVEDEEAALFADFTDTDDEDIYFGGGVDEDADYDDKGNELRPQKKKKETWADPDPPIVDEVETDPDEEEKEFAEVFGKNAPAQTRRPKPIKREEQSASFARDPKNRPRQWEPRPKQWEPRTAPKTDILFAEGFRRDANTQLTRGRPQRNVNPQLKQTGQQETDKIDFSVPDPDLGIDEVMFKKQFDKMKQKGEAKPVLKSDFSPDEFLKENEASSDEGAESDWDEEKMVQAGDEELEELTDVSNMIRDYDRPSQHQSLLPVTEEMAEEAKQEEMETEEYYESDDVEYPNAEDPKLQQEIAEEHEENMKRLSSTPGGRKTLKELNADQSWMDDFPETDRRLYENALRDAPHDGPPPNPGQRYDRRERRQPSPPPKRNVQFASKDDDVWELAPTKGADSWRTLSNQFDSEANDTDFLSDLHEEDDEQEEEEQQQQHYRPMPRGGGRRPMQRGGGRRPRGRAPYGGPGIRFYSTERRIESHDEEISTRDWREKAVERTHAAKVSQRHHIIYYRNVNRATHLHRYWSRFPSDEKIQSLCTSVQKKIKWHGTLYVAMTGQGQLLFGVTAPKHTIKGATNVADQFKQPSDLPSFVKVDLKRFRRMKQRGEILTGGPHMHGAFNGESTAHDWTGCVW